MEAYGMNKEMYVVLSLSKEQSMIVVYIFIKYYSVITIIYIIITLRMKI